MYISYIQSSSKSKIIRENNDLIKDVIIDHRPNFP
nr:MAG TPA_asm: hypothetical protein [Caudoviricetes sp.]